jgi:hypothetical protein
VAIKIKLFTHEIIIKAPKVVNTYSTPFIPLCACVKRDDLIAQIPVAILFNAAIADLTDVISDTVRLSFDSLCFIDI